jgi:hypothetical protein
MSKGNVKAMNNPTISPDSDAKIVEAERNIL